MLFKNGNIYVYSSSQANGTKSELDLVPLAWEDDACADPERFVRGWNYDNVLFACILVDKGREDQHTSKSGSLFACK